MTWDSSVGAPTIAPWPMGWHRSVTSCEPFSKVVTRGFTRCIPSIGSRPRSACNSLKTILRFSRRYLHNSSRNGSGTNFPASTKRRLDMNHRLQSPCQSRRTFLQGTTAALLAGSVATPLPPLLQAAQQQASANVGDLRVTEIESHEVTLEYHEWLSYQFNHFYGPVKRTIYVVHTNRGLVGLGESGSTESAATIKKYQDTNPFDWVGDETSLGLGTAMYDLMGQAAGVPVYKLFGQRYRRWVPVGAWTVSTHPKRMAEAVTRYAARGYRWLKFHLSPFENILDQFKAMQSVAPKGFKIHLDFTMHGTNDHVVELLDKISAFPIAGCYEDPLFEKDIEAYAGAMNLNYHRDPANESSDFRR
ncbi:MAG TPA: twin-arginine translocation signal domain-containing protein, partial [Planctomycetaceae bacterium]|nr:twin-arginine translocation signal domain-containing protein [Planctomycetaceae bacterium]